MIKKCIKINKKKAETTIKELKEENLIDLNYIIKKEKDYVLIPLKNNKTYTKYKSQITKEDFLKHKPKQKTFKEVLFNKIPKKDLKKINKSYDIVGDIVIIRIEENLKKYYEKIGKAIKKIHPQTKTVLNKKEHHGVFRGQFLEYVYGIDKRETTIKENNIRIKIDVENVFCSTRLSSERKRISKLVKKEEVCVFFAGAGPFCLCFAKNNPSVKSVYGIELNPIAVNYFKENIKINKLDEKIICLFGDVSEISKNYKEKFDRIVMPHPTASEKYLKDAIYCLKDKGIIHFYKFVSKDKAFEEAEELIKNNLKKHYKNIKIENKKILLSYSPSIVEVVYDLRYSK
jgi:tRNA (guanine37-N1)-methyltransferase